MSACRPQGADDYPHQPSRIALCLCGERQCGKRDSARNQLKEFAAGNLYQRADAVGEYRAGCNANRAMTIDEITMKTLQDRNLPNWTRR
jgi:hypothetical protein